MTLAKFSTLIDKPKAEPKPQPTKPTEPKPKSPAREALEHHVSGAVERGEAKAIVAVELDRDSDTETVATWAATHTTARVEIIGSWVWLTYPSKPARSELDMLKANGFRWARKRKQWAHACGVFTRSNPKIAHPRQKYGSVVVKDEDES